MKTMQERKVFYLGRIRRGRSEREPIATITQDYVQMNRHILTPRDIAIMELLKDFPIMTTEHLVELTPQTLMPNGKPIAAFHQCKKGFQLCRDRIRRLFDYHFVNKASPRLGLGEGTSPQYVWLDRAGYRLLDLEGRPPKTLTMEYLHHARILDVYCLFHRLHRKGFITVDLLQACYRYKPHTTNIEPDLMVAFRKGNFGYKYLIEVDNCEKKEKEELTKLQKYKDWEYGSHWIKEEWAELYSRRFPTVLYLFSGSERKVRRRVKVFKDYATEIECRCDTLALEELEEKIHSLKE